MVEGFQGNSRLHLSYVGVACARLNTGAARRQRDVAPQRDAQRELVLGPHRIDGGVSVCAIVRSASRHILALLLAVGYSNLNPVRGRVCRPNGPLALLFMTRRHPASCSNSCDNRICLLRSSYADGEVE